MGVQNRACFVYMKLAPYIQNPADQPNAFLKMLGAVLTSYQQDRKKQNNYMLGIKPNSMGSMFI